MFALVMSEDRISVQPRRSEIIQGLRDLPDHIQQVLGQDQKVSRLAESLYTKKSLLVMGRGYRSVTVTSHPGILPEISIPETF